MAKKVTYRCVSEDGETRMMRVDVETGKKIVSRKVDEPKVTGPMRVSYGNTYRVRSELARYARKNGLEII